MDLKKIYYKIKKLFLSKHFIIFVIIGLINTLIYNSTYILLLKCIPYLLSSVIGYIISMTVSFFLNSKFNYKIKPTIKKYIMFPLSGIPTLFMQTVGLTIFIEYLSIPENYGGILASVVAIPFSYIVMNIILKK